MATYTPKCVKDVPAEDFIKAYAAHLKSGGKFAVPTWVDIVKTAAHKELPPLDADWYFIRAAAVARKLYYRQDIGVGMFAKLFGTRNKRRGVRPERHAKASRGLLRTILKSLEAISLVEKSTTAKGGRRLSPQGQRDMDLIAGRVQVTLEEF